MEMPNSKSLRVYAQQNTAASWSITIDDLERVNQGLVWKSVQLITAIAKRWWWHTKGYGTILGIMLLTLVSIIFLVIHWSYGQLLSFFSHGILGSREWHIRSSK